MKAIRIKVLLLSITILLTSFLILSTVRNDNKNRKDYISGTVNATEKWNHLSDIDKNHKFKLKTNTNIDNDNLNNYIKIYDNTDSLVRNTISKKFVIAPEGGYKEGVTYRMFLYNGVRVEHDKVQDNTEIMFSIRKPEKNEIQISSTVIELKDEEVILYDEESENLVLTGSYKIGQLLMFNNGLGKNAVRLLSKNAIEQNYIYETEVPSVDEVFDALDVSTKKMNASEKDVVINIEELENSIMEEFNAINFEVGGTIVDSGLNKTDTKIKFEFNDQFGKIEISCKIKTRVSQSIKADLVGQFSFSIKFSMETQYNKSGDYYTKMSVETESKIKFSFEIDGTYVNDIEVGENIDNPKLSEWMKKQETITQLDSNSEKKISLFSIPIAIPIPLVDVIVFDLDLFLTTGISGKIGVEQSLKTYNEIGAVSTGLEESTEINNSDKTKFESETTFFIEAKAEFKAGIRLSVTVKAIAGMFQAKLSVETGVYIELGGTFSLKVKKGTKNEESIIPINKVEFKTELYYPLIYIEVGVYAKVSVEVKFKLLRFLEKNLVKIELDLVKIPFIQIGSRQVSGLIMQEEEKILVDEPVKVPEIQVVTYDIYSGKQIGKKQIVTTDDELINVKTAGNYQIENGYIVDKNPINKDEVYELTIELLNPSFKNIGLGIEMKKFYNSLYKPSKEDDGKALVGDVRTFKIIKKIIDVESFDINSNAKFDNCIEIGSSIILSGKNFMPTNATFQTLKYELVNSITGVSIQDDRMLAVNNDAEVGSEVVVKVSTVRNRKKQIFTTIKFTIIKPQIEDFEIYLSNADDYGMFHGKTIVPFGATINLFGIFHPSDLVAKNVEYTVKSGSMYIEESSLNGDKILESKFRIKNNPSNDGNREIEIVAKVYIYNIEMISKVLTIKIDESAIQNVELKHDGSIVSPGEKSILKYDFVPSNASIVDENMLFYMEIHSQELHLMVLLLLMLMHQLVRKL